MKLFRRIFIAFLLVFSLCSNCFGEENNSNNSLLKANDITTYSPTCILMEASTGKVIYEKNGYEKAYPASTTKIMTAILALENCNLTDIAKVSYQAVYSVPSRIYKC